MEQQTITNTIANIPIGRVSKHISLIDFNNIYQQLTHVNHTIEASFLSAVMLADMKYFTIHLSGYFVPDALHRKITLAARLGRLGTG